VASCTEKARLFLERQAEVTAFRQVLTLLNLIAVTASNEEFLHIRQRANEQDAKSEQALLALEQHVEEHGG
jgi:hypothetical protein